MTNLVGLNNRTLIELCANSYLVTFSLLYSSWLSAPVGWNVIITMILNLIFVSLYQATKKEAIDNNFGGYEVQYTANIY